MSRPAPPVRTDGRLQGPLLESPAFVLMQAGRLAMDRTAAALEPLGLQVAQFATLAMIERLEPITQAALAERLGISKSAISRVVINLVDSGLAARVGDDALRALAELAPPNLTPVQTALQALGFAIRV